MELIVVEGVGMLRERKKEIRVTRGQTELMALSRFWFGSKVFFLRIFLLLSFTIPLFS